MSFGGRMVFIGPGANGRNLSKMPISKPKNYIDFYRLKSQSVDINELSGRTGRADLTQFIAHQIASKLNFKDDDVLVDIGCGDGSLLKLAAESGIDGRRGRIIGILPTDEELDRVQRSLSIGMAAAIQVIKGLSHQIHLPNECASKTVINGVMTILGSEFEVDSTLAEIRRITKPGGILFIGEIPDTDEFASRNYGDSIVLWLFWVLKHRGMQPFMTSLKQTISRVVASEPFLIAPKRVFWMEPNRFLPKLKDAGFQLVEHYRHKEISLQGTSYDSSTRWDYIVIRV